MTELHDQSQTIPLDLPGAPRSTPPAPGTNGGPSGPRVSVLAVDRELAAAVPASDLPRAQRALWTASLSFEAGPIDLDSASLAPTVFALLLVKGAMLRRTGLSDRPMIELLLAGDVVSPWAPSHTAPVMQRSLVARGDVRLAVLDERFMKVAAVWPTLMVAIHRRLNNQQHRLATHGAISQLPRVEQRVMAIMRLLAARSGIVTVRGTELLVTLTHEEIAQLTGSRRPTVSLAIKELRRHGHLDRLDDGTWLLPRRPGDATWSP